MLPLCFVNQRRYRQGNHSYTTKTSLPLKHPKNVTMTSPTNKKKRKKRKKVGMISYDLKMNDVLIPKCRMFNHRCLWTDAE